MQRGILRLSQSQASLRQKVGIAGNALFRTCVTHKTLKQQPAHTLKDVRVNITGLVAKISRHDALHRMAIHHVTLDINLLYHPNATGNSNLVVDWWRFDNGAKFLRLTAHRVFLILLKHRIELEVVHLTLSRNAYDESAPLGALYMVGLEQMTQQHTEVVLCDIAEIAQRQHARCQFGWHHLTIGSQCGHGLMIKQAVGQTASARRLHPFLFQIELHQGDALQQLPGYGLRQQGTGLSGILTYHKPHLRRGTAAARTAHALQKRRHGVGCIYLKRPL